MGGDAELTKECTKCHEVKLRADFSRDARSRDGLRSRCKVCVSDRQAAAYAADPAAQERARARAAAQRERGELKDWKAANPDRADYHSRKSKYKALYGITPEDYDRLLAQQGGRCAICGRLPGKVRLAVDHCHKTGEVRGLLCGRQPGHNCNQGLGYFSDSPGRLRAAADYLERPPAQYLDWRDE